MSTFWLQPTASAIIETNNNDTQYFFGWHILMGSVPLLLKQCHTQPIYTTAPTSFQIFTHMPTDYYDQDFAISWTYWADDSENWYAPETPDAGFILQANTDYWLLNRDDGNRTGCDFPFWDSVPSHGLQFPVQTNNGNPLQILYPLLDGNDIDPPSNFPFPGALYELLMDTNVITAKPRIQAFIYG